MYNKEGIKEDKKLEEIKHFRNYFKINNETIWLELDEDGIKCFESPNSVCTLYVFSYQCDLKKLDEKYFKIQENFFSVILRCTKKFIFFENLQNYFLHNKKILQKQEVVPRTRMFTNLSNIFEKEMQNHFIFTNLDNSSINGRVSSSIKKITRISNLMMNLNNAEENQVDQEVEIDKDFVGEKIEDNYFSLSFQHDHSLNNPFTDEEENKQPQERKNTSFFRFLDRSSSIGVEKKKKNKKNKAKNDSIVLEDFNTNF